MLYNKSNKFKVLFKRKLNNRTIIGEIIETKMVFEIVLSDVESLARTWIIIFQLSAKNR